MPANLNALIRYKTINSCLFRGKRKWSIAELTGKCSDALGEYRGRYEPVSERTIREDIRVMRSDILGYNAPILQQNGLYFYSDPEYSIMSVTLTDSDLIKKIITLLEDIKHEVSHPELEIILKRLNGIMPGFPEPPAPSKARRSEDRIPSEECDEVCESPETLNESLFSYSGFPVWANIFDAIFVKNQR